ncbi:MAG: NAD-glutamate dehydrogenase [Ahrensia sp.]|nr:NAD-glutamate dehydrogenase [Ahrensia sp.]
MDQTIETLLPEYMQNWVNEHAAKFKRFGLKDADAKRLALLPLRATLPDIAAISSSTECDMGKAADAFYRVTETFQIGRLEHLALQLDTDDYFDGLAQQRALDTIYSARNAITVAALTANQSEPKVAIDDWIDRNKTRIARVKTRISELTGGGNLTVSRLTVAAGLLTDLVG